MNIPKYIWSAAPNGNFYVKISDESPAKVVFSFDKKAAQSEWGDCWVEVYEKEQFISCLVLDDTTELAKQRRALERYLPQNNSYGPPLVTVFWLSGDNREARRVTKDCTIGVMLRAIVEFRKHAIGEKGGRYYVYHSTDTKNTAWVGDASAADGLDMSCHLEDNIFAINGGKTGPADYSTVLFTRTAHSAVFSIDNEPVTNYGFLYSSVVYAGNVVPMTDVLSLSYIELNKKYGYVRFLVMSDFDPTAPLGRSYEGYFTNHPNAYDPNNPQKVVAFALRMKDLFIAGGNDFLFASYNTVIEANITGQDPMDRFREMVGKTVSGVEYDDIVTYGQYHQELEKYLDDSQSCVITYTCDGNRHAAKMTANPTLTPYVLDRIKELGGTDLKTYLASGTQRRFTDKALFFLREKDISLPTDVAKIGYILSYLGSLGPKSLPVVRRVPLFRGRDGEVPINFHLSGILTRLYLGIISLQSELMGSSQIPSDLIKNIHWNGKRFMTNIVPFINDSNIAQGRDLWYGLDITIRTYLLHIIALVLDDRDLDAKTLSPAKDYYDVVYSEFARVTSSAPFKIHRDYVVDLIQTAVDETVEGKDFLRLRRRTSAS